MRAQLSKQTPAGQSGFFFNPFAGCDIHLFPVDRDPKNPRRFMLSPVHPFDAEPDTTAIKAYDPETGKPIYRRLKQATACGGRVIVSRDSCGNTRVTVNGKPTERYSIVPPKTRKKTHKPFAFS